MSPSRRGRRLRGARLSLALLPLAYAADVCATGTDEKRASPDSVEFDENMLKLRGIDPKLAHYFREAPRFTSGHHVVSLVVNGHPAGEVNVRFDEKGGVCVDRTLLDAAGLVPNHGANDACLSLEAFYPAATIDAVPGKGMVSLVVPTDALRAPVQDVSAYGRGGTAAMINYEMTGLSTTWGSRRNRYVSANTEAGINIGDWVLRSRQVSTSTDGHVRSEVLDSYAQRSFPEHAAVLQLGELNIVNAAVPGAQITGAQVTTELALPAQARGSVVEGTALSQARVEVRQNGVLMYSTVVPAGPFALADMPRINRFSDLDVTVLGTDGQSQHFVVPAALAGAATPSAGYAFAGGKVRRAGGGKASWVASASWSGSVRRGMSLSGGLLATSTYRALGFGLGLPALSATQVQFNIIGTDAPRERARGMQTTLTVSRRVTDRLSFGVSHSRQSRGYRDLSDTTRRHDGSPRPSRYRDQSTATGSWSHPALGNISVGYSRTVLPGGQDSHRALMSWGTRVARASVSLSGEWNLGGGRRAGGSSMYLNVSVPLGPRRRLTTSARRSTGGMRFGANLAERINDYASYRAGMEYQPLDRRRSMTLGLSLLPRYAQVDTSYARNPGGNSYSLGVRGSLVGHAHGVTASPYAVDDTFGVLSVGDAAGVRVSTPSGPVWTDARGYAVLPQLNPFGRNRVEVATDSLARDIDIQNGAAVVEVARGAVATLRFGVARTRRLLLSARRPDGTVLPIGATVTDDQGELVSLVQADGQIFVPNALATPHLWVESGDLPRCELNFERQARAETGTYFESSDALCRPDGKALR